MQETIRNLRDSEKIQVMSVGHLKNENKKSSTHKPLFHDSKSNMKPGNLTLSESWWHVSGQLGDSPYNPQNMAIRMNLLMNDTILFLHDFDERRISSNKPTSQ